MRPNRPSFWKIKAQEIREKNSRIARTQRATKPVCARMSKILPMKMADRKEIMSVPHLEQNFADKASVADEWNRVKGMRCDGRRKSSLGEGERDS